MPRSFLLTAVCLVVCFALRSSAQSCDNDTIPPVIKLNTSDSIIWGVNVPYSRKNPTYSDNCSALDSLQIEQQSNVNPFLLGKYRDLYRVFDEKGNETVKGRFVEIVDTFKPEILYSGPDTIYQHQLSSSNQFSFEPDFLFRDNYWSPFDLKQSLQEVENNVDPTRIGTYKIVYQTTDGSGNVSSPLTIVVIINTIGIKDANKNRWTLQPNPFSTELSITMESVEAGFIVIRDAAGRVVYNQKIESSRKMWIETSSWSQGIYYARYVSVNGQNWSEKIVCQNLADISD
jgi:hypothetical protein